ncbi:MAG: hypothetical protein EBR30_26835, partial [Cytophagia bacterium]|nr:hypothetical protein [Cytophagia bacterium]
MKKISAFLILTFYLCSCSSPDKIALTSLGEERDRYIYDFNSRVAQQKMQVMRSNYAQASIGVSVIDGVGNSFNPPQQADTYTFVPRFFRNIIIINKTGDMLYADVINNRLIDNEYNCSVLNIQLPPKERIVILAYVDDSYELKYGASPESKTNQYTFSPYEGRKLFVEKNGVNLTKIY